MIGLELPDLGVLLPDCASCTPDPHPGLCGNQCKEGHDDPLANVTAESGQLSLVSDQGAVFPACVSVAVVANL